MVEETIQQVIGDILAGEGFVMRRILLFGSRARGEAGPSSDWDLLVLVDREIEVPSQQRLITAIRREFARLRIPNDVMIQSEAQFARRKEIPGLLSYVVAQEGVPL
jgi:uncharacterized protein